MCPVSAIFALDDLPEKWKSYAERIAKYFGRHHACHWWSEPCSARASDPWPVPIARSLERVGEWWSILILRDAFHGLTRFDQFQKSLDIAPNMLTRRLNALVESGLLERRRYSEHPPRDEYVLTERGRDFRPVLWALLAWGNKHFAPEGPSVIVIDTETGEPADPVMVDRRDRQGDGRAGVPLGAGPGADERTSSVAMSGPECWRRPRSSRGRAARSTARISRKQLGLAGAALLLGIGAAWYGHDWWTVGRFIESTDDAYVGGDITVIAPKVSGFIAEVAVTDNQAVHAGDLLVKLDDRDYRAALAKAVAAVAGQQATLANLEATRRLQEAMIAQAQAGIDRGRGRDRPAREDRVERYRSSGAGSGGLDAGVPEGRRRLQAGDRRGARARAALDAAQRQLDVIDTQKQQTEAALAGAIADRDTAQLNLGYTELRAPIDGTVGNRSARTGAYAAVGAQLISIVPAHGLWVDANFKENQLAHMHAGDAGDDRGGRAARRGVPRPCREPGAGDRRQFSVLPPENATGNFTKIVQRVPVRVLLDGDAADAGPAAPGPVGHRRRRRAMSATTADVFVAAGPNCRWRRRCSPSPAMCVGFFIALLDIQIVSASLRGHRRRTVRRDDEVAWVQTSYLIAEIIVIPLSGWLSRVMSTRWLFCASAAGFTITSLLCGWAWNIESMIVFRALQGFLGGSMIPTVFTTAFIYFQQPAARHRSGDHRRASRRWRRRWGRPSAAGSPTTTPGTGCSSSTWCRASSSPSWCRCWCGSTSRTCRCCGAPIISAWR